ncbi:hypothetical protein M0R88_05930 [Halorussus gelatinilyticus]|uniref:Uncharacterized protein n=1 Tax=Halorussus gelatinilyticus TaxID=2937524 RepID=A0A8U0ILJ4_9EURY|nr:hypothetical protein [Halorussus gelatinilyticus]UPW01638.1 hypothetical protein M0R88_05930 [Halorussus gelatinilyticus]
MSDDVPDVLYIFPLLGLLALIFGPLAFAVWTGQGFVGIMLSLMWPPLLRAALAT